jgi:hypothetical protein
VTIHDTLPDGPYQSRGHVQCSYGMNAKPATTNVRLCRKELKREAAEAGATVVVLNAHQLMPTGGNRVMMSGTAFAKDEPTDE